jgi:hypothetical protein
VNKIIYHEETLSLTGGFAIFCRLAHRSSNDTNL